MSEALLQDVRHALRSIRRSPGFSLVVIVTMALAIGANTALFSLFNALVLRAVPMRDPSRVVVLTPINERGTGAPFVYEATLQHVRSVQHVFDSLAMYSGGGFNRVEARGVAADGMMEGVDPQYFEMVGARAALGRLLTPDDALGREGVPVIVLSDRFWRRLFAGDPRAIGEPVRIDGRSLTVVGVLDPGFRGLQADSGTDLFMTMPTLRARAGDMTRPVRARNVIARLRLGVTLGEAREQMTAQWPSARVVDVPGLPAADQQTLRTQTVNVESIAAGFSPLRDRYADPLALLFGLTALLLAIGCANLSGLMLARAASYEQEMAVRRALGASRARLIQHLLVQALTLAAAGVALATPFAWWASRALEVALTAGNALPSAATMTPDSRVLAASALVATLSGLLVSALPAWRATRAQAALVVDGSRVMPGHALAGRVLIVAQIALTLVLLVAASLFAQSMTQLRGNDVGHEPSQLVWARLWSNPGDRTPTFGREYWTALAVKLSGIPGVESVAYAFNFPALLGSAPLEEKLSIADASGAVDDVDGVADAISPGFFHTTGIALLQGRDIAWTDTAQTPMVGIVSAALAHKLFPDGQAMGRRIRLGRDASRPIEIVGVAADAAVGNVHDPKPRVLYRPLLQEPSRARVPNALVRGRSDVTALRKAYAEVAVTSGHHFTRRVYTLDESASQALLRERLVAWLSSFFAALAVLLSCIGIYSLLAYAVTRRTREIGVRMALGATPQAMLRAVAREGCLLGAIGVAAGVPLALAAGRFTRTLLYGLAPNDPLTLTAASAAFIALAGLSGLIPAYRAASIDPMAALRSK